MSDSDLNVNVNVRGSITRNTVHTVTSQWLLHALSPMVKWRGLEADSTFSTKIK
jgi:hypothetical protein